jgi:hypothetical protein
MTGGSAGKLAVALELLATRLISGVLSGAVFSVEAADGFAGSAFFGALVVVAFVTALVEVLSATA